MTALRRRWHRVALPAGGLVVLLGLLGRAPAGEAATVQIRADVILASNEGTGTDERLAHVAKQLQEAPYKYSRYELVAAPAGTAQVAQPWQVPLPGGRVLEVTPTAMSEGSYQLRVRVLGARGEQIMGTNVRIPSGRTIFIGGPPHAPGVLIIALSAS